MTRTLIMTLAALGGGFLVAAGVVALLVGLGIITRFTGISHTALHNRLYETSVCLGALFGNLLTVYRVPAGLGWPGLLLLGISAGVYVGGWIMALAEVIHIFPVFARRIGLVKGLSFLVIAVALGKMAGSLLFFYMRW